MVHVAVIMHNDAIDMAGHNLENSYDPQVEEKDMCFSDARVQGWIAPPVPDDLGPGAAAESHLKKGLMRFLRDENVIHGREAQDF